MIMLVNVLWAVLLAMVSATLAAGILFFWKKHKIESSLSIQAGTGDQEVMIFNYNFKTGESLESKASKIHEAFDSFQTRKDENHAKWLEIKAKAIEENSEKKPEDLKLRSIVE